MRGCDEELCPNWSGDGMVCPCALFGLGLPPGFTPAWAYLRTEDGVVELEHEGGRIAREAMEATMKDTTSHDEIVRHADAMQRGIDGATGAFERCRKAGNDLAAAIRNLPESEAKTALYPAYETFMSLDSGNFHEEPS